MNNAYLDLLLVAVITIYSVDVSGFTDAWRSLLARMLRIKALRPLPPFDCGKCATFWATIIYSAFNWGITLPLLAFCAVLSLLSYPIGQILIFMREGLTWLTNKILPR